VLSASVELSGVTWTRNGESSDVADDIVPKSGCGKFAQEPLPVRSGTHVIQMDEKSLRIAYRDHDRELASR
jgi:hypothetical protein